MNFIFVWYLERSLWTPTTRQRFEETPSQPSFPFVGNNYIEDDYKVYIIEILPSFCLIVSETF